MRSTRHQLQSQNWLDSCYVSMCVAVMGFLVTCPGCFNCCIWCRFDLSLIMNVVKGCPCTPEQVMEGHWKGGQPKLADGRGIFDSETNTFVSRPDDPNSPNIGWWYMIHGGRHSQNKQWQHQQWLQYWTRRSGTTNIYCTAQTVGHEGLTTPEASQIFQGLGMLTEYCFNPFMGTASLSETMRPLHWNYCVIGLWAYSKRRIVKPICCPVSTICPAMWCCESLFFQVLEQ